MNIYYRITQVYTDSHPTIYELEIPFQGYYINIYTYTTHLPHKRLAKYRPLYYLMIFPGDFLGIEVYPKDGDAMKLGHMIEIEIEKPNKETLKLLIEKVGGGICSSRRDIKPEDIVNEFLKTLLIEQ